MGSPLSFHSHHSLHKPPTESVSIGISRTIDPPSVQIRDSAEAETFSRQLNSSPSWTRRQPDTHSPTHLLSPSREQAEAEGSHLLHSSSNGTSQSSDRSPRSQLVTTKSQPHTSKTSSPFQTPVITSQNVHDMIERIARTAR